MAATGTLKAYAADPETVIKSAQSLALFGAGKRIDTNLLRRERDRQQS